jgi:serine/threonine-protein kinase
VEVARALELAHSRGLVHRDIKPENILLSEGQAVLADFGIARVVAVSDGTKLTETGTSLGTPAYMSPEQAMGGDPVDERSDLYSLACVLFEMLSGRPPFIGPTAESVVHQHLTLEPPLVTALRPSVPEAQARALNRALAKAPADRFSTMSQFVAALGTPATLRSAGPVARRKALPRTTIAFAVAFLLLIVALAWAGWKGVGPLAAAFGGRAPVEPGKKALILLAEFDGPAEIAAAAHDLLGTAIDQSGIVATVPTDELKTALRQAGRPDTTRIDATLARELAYRRSIRAVVEGRISPVGKGYSIALRVVDVDSSRTVLSLSETAASDEALIPSISRLGRKLRAELGERRSAIQADRPLVLALTPSFEAYQKYLRAMHLANEEFDSRGAIVLAREALTLDPDYAAAWALIGSAYANTGRVDSARVAYTEALKRPDRLTEPGRLNVEGSLARLRGDLPAALAIYEQMLRQNLTPSQAAMAYNNRANVLMNADRCDDAIESYKQAMAASPFGPRQVHVINLLFALYRMKRVEEARGMVAQLKDPRAHSSWELAFACSEGTWAVAESLGVAIQDDQTANIEVRANAAIAAAASEATRGEVQAAVARLRRAEATCTGINKRAAAGPWWEELMLAAASGHGPPPFLSLGADDTIPAIVINKGAWAVLSGDTTLARRTVRVLRGHPALNDEDRAGADLIEGWIAARARNWSRVVRLFGAMTRDSVPASWNMETERMAMQWLIADAHEGLGQPDSAATALESMVSRWRCDDGQVERGIWYSFAQRRLVLLYARMGHVADARKHWDVFARTFTHPDPDLIPQVEEARTALASAEGVSRSARR